MSRCFPFPPPGYAGKCSSNEALILSIKLQKENEKVNSDRERKKAKSDRKKEMREMKEKKQQEKSKEKSNNAGYDGGKHKLVEDLPQVSMCLGLLKDKLPLKNSPQVSMRLGLPKDKQVECDLVERSGVTEEHGQPVESQNISSSSDSTGNSSKRKRPATPPNSLQRNGTIIRIRLSSSQKTDEPSVRLSSSQMTDEPSTSGRNEQDINLLSQRRRDLPGTSYSKIQPSFNLARREPSIKQKEVVAIQAPHVYNSNHASTSTATFELAPRPVEMIPSLPEKKTQLAPPEEKKLSSHERKMLKKESQYKQLFETFCASMTTPGDLPVDEGDDDWLFGGKAEERPAKRTKVAEDDSSSRDTLMSCAAAVIQPRAQFLPDAEMYALPFTVPF